MEITLTEMGLFAWAIIATGFWLEARQDARVAKHVLRIFIENREARDNMVDAFEKFKKEGRTV